MGEAFSQADLDLLLGDLASAPVETKIETGAADCAVGGDENLSQDQIDELLKQFLG